MFFNLGHYLCLLKIQMPAFSLTQMKSTQQRQKGTQKWMGTRAWSNLSRAQVWRFLFVPRGSKNKREVIEKQNSFERHPATCRKSNQSLDRRTEGHRNHWEAWRVSKLLTRRKFYGCGQTRGLETQEARYWISLNMYRSPVSSSVDSLLHSYYQTFSRSIRLIPK